PRAFELTRRRFLEFGGAATLSAGGLLRLQAELADKARTPAIRSCIFVCYYGGPSHFETYDPKPLAPSTVRGEFQPISTSVPGMQICEHLPHMAKVMHHCALIRSMHHTNRLHDSASIETHTGRQAAQGDREEFAPIEQFFPSHGGALSYLWRERRLAVAHAGLPWVFHNVVDVPCQGGGFLGSAYDPFRITVDPEHQQYTVNELLLRPDLPAPRIDRRRNLLSTLQSETAIEAEGELDQFYEKAYQLLGSEKVRRALDLSEETPAMRERYGVYSTDSQGGGNGAEKAYGRHMRGQNLLVARRLVEAGVPFVNVFDFRQQGQNWDSHNQNFSQHKDHLLPPADRALAALIGDLSERGLLDSTLIVATGEFGRTPQINNTAGRDHWPDCYTVLLAGGGVQGGAIYGASDALGAYPAKSPVTPADLAATIYWRFGFDPALHIRDRLSRPYRLADGEPIRDVFA
ncbi:MAG TPA: DUF1501 domain-containing protein, partial [Planctomycetaceae bacterium]|nr:DUF1501 domain-containing protein [Planctomycetaceae bacterium]